MLCNKCNQPLPDDSEFCQYCGTKLEVAATDEKNTDVSKDSVVNIEVVEVTEELSETKVENTSVEIVEHEASVLTVVDETSSESANQQNAEVHSNDEIEETQQEKPIETLVSTPSSNKKAPKTRYCKMCGSLIDSETKKCTSCGKQFFKLPKLNKTVLLVIICSVLLGLNIFQCIQLTQTKTTIVTQNKTIQKQEEKLAGKTNWNISGRTKTSFMNEYIVIINDREKTYHKFGCKYLRRSSFLAYNVANAKALGYRACSSCN